MSKFKDIAAVADAFVLDHFGGRFLWTKTDESTEVVNGILDIELEQYGSNGEFSSSQKTFTGKTSVLSSFRKRETIQELDDDDAVVGAVYELQDEVENDGNFITIELIS